MWPTRILNNQCIISDTLTPRSFTGLWCICNKKKYLWEPESRQTLRSIATEPQCNVCILHRSSFTVDPKLLSVWNSWFKVLNVIFLGNDSDIYGSILDNDKLKSLSLCFICCSYKTNNCLQTKYTMIVFLIEWANDKHNKKYHCVFFLCNAQMKHLADNLMCLSILLITCFSCSWLACLHRGIFWFCGPCRGCCLFFFSYSCSSLLCFLFLDFLKDLTQKHKYHETQKQQTLRDLF